MPNLERDGVRLHPCVLTAGEVARFRVGLDRLAQGERTPGLRNLLTTLPGLRALAGSARMTALLPAAMRPAARPVRATLFDKVGTRSWAIRWHQDLAIAIRAEAEVEGFHGWSVKRGVPHVLAPIALLERMMALRLHLDDADESSGALQIVVGTHRLGRIPRPEIKGLIAERGSVTCVAGAGDVLAMRPLVLHRSDRATGARRRILHLEYAAEELPPPLAWHEAGPP